MKDQIETLRAALAAVDTRLHVLEQCDDPAGLVLQVIRDAAAHLQTDPKAGGVTKDFSPGDIRVAVTDEPLLRELGIIERLRDTGHPILEPPAHDVSPGEAEAWKQELAGVHVGLTSALGIAEETGSMLLTPREPDQRAVSLLPVVHVAVLRADQIVPTIDDLMARWVETGDTRGSAVFITGPSRTADIEKELVLGVHGPQAVDVVIVP